MDARCRDCEAGLAHCHGTLIMHSLRYAECTEDGCGNPESITHTFVLDCDAVGCRCAQPIGSAGGWAAPFASTA